MRLGVLTEDRFVVVSKFSGATKFFPIMIVGRVRGILVLGNRPLDIFYSRKTRTDESPTVDAFVLDFWSPTDNGI